MRTAPLALKSAIDLCVQDAMHSTKLLTYLLVVLLPGIHRGTPARCQCARGATRWQQPQSSWDSWSSCAMAARTHSPPSKLAEGPFHGSGAVSAL